MKTRTKVQAGVLGAAALTLTLPPGVAVAADNGNWESVSCGDRGEACMWQRDINFSRHVASSTRDSNFNNDYYVAGQSVLLNDDVKYIANHFGTLEVRGFRDADYGRALSCIPAGSAYGPYTYGNDDGVSSFKSC